ncbi:hypothetical protein TH4_20975 [Thalassospira tepidiphila MCCC 1A03514]|uniref:THIF-type NAD/FAD binding fold domain-containing protein n=2 Tax=Thalassospira tepidiphila TaxID=393657 RepID=A0A853KUW9_9PROT|nr:hypothetical protein TH4_20975 [Thalassospira tepidiphila MCCC 1A03514]
MDEMPVPCIVDGKLDEYFAQFGLLEAGVFSLLNQLVKWLQNAAQGTLISASQGWEPTLRESLDSLLFLNAEHVRENVNRRGGFRLQKATFLRSGSNEDQLLDKAMTFVTCSDEAVPLNSFANSIEAEVLKSKLCRGHTVCIVLWSGKDASGKEFVDDEYASETVTTFSDLKARADRFGCRSHFDTVLAGLERVWELACRSKKVGSEQSYFVCPIPVTVIFCVRRPVRLIGEHNQSSIEILPYTVEFRPSSDSKSLLQHGNDEPVAPCSQLDITNPTLLRNVSGEEDLSPVAFLGAGSVGSKIALHLAKCGVEISAITDNGNLSPHNNARHALIAPAGGLFNKAKCLADEMRMLGQTVEANDIDLREITDAVSAKRILPKRTQFALNTTASLLVREAVDQAQGVTVKLAEGALFAEGNGAYLLCEGDKRNPRVSDLVAEMYAVAPDAVLKQLTDERHGLTEVQIGQGCASLTMRISDAQVSSMSATLSQKFTRWMKEKPANGRINLGLSDPNTLNCHWQELEVDEFTIVPIDGIEGWQLRISARVINIIQGERAKFSDVETGGVLIGVVSARLKSITVVDTLEAPDDSKRSATLFVLGTSGLKESIRARYLESGHTLIDVGTWHTHLSNCGPSDIDRKTAQDIANERPPPSVLLIVAPDNLFAISAKAV